MKPLWTVPIARRPPDKPAAWKVVLGLDPGSEGAAVALSLVSDSAKAWRLPGAKLDGFPIADLSRIRDAFKVPPLCFMEKVSAETKWGKSGFAFGARAGGMASLLASFGWETHMVHPHKWQALFHPGHQGDAKARSLAAYRVMFPDAPLPKNAAGRDDHNVLDAFLIAVYGAMSLGHRPRKWRFG